MAEQDAPSGTSKIGSPEEPAPVTSSSPGKPAGTPHPVETGETGETGKTSETGGGAHADDDSEDFGDPGPPVNRNSPFYIGFFGALGALIAWEALKVVGNLSGVLTLVGVAAFLAIGLDPLVRWLQRRGLSRGLAVAAVFVAVILIFAGFIAAVVPTVITQGGQLAQQLPDQVDNLLKSKTLSDLDKDYGVITNLSEQLRKRVSDGATIMSLFGGVLGAGKAVLNGFVSTFTVLVLTLYFLASLNSIAEALYRLVPATRRPRFRSLGDEIIRRIGGYVAGQVAVASINAVCSFILMTVLGIPYSLVLSITVGVLGLIPLVGATIGAVVVVLVGLFQSWEIGAIVAVYYLLYQQVENYVIAPRIMSRTVSVPGAVALIAALAGAGLLGVLGALIAIPIAAAILLIVQEVLIPRMDRT